MSLLQPAKTDSLCHFEQFWVWKECACFGNGETRPMHRITFFPIVELFFDSLTDLYRILRRHGYVAPVKQGVKVLPEQECIVYGVLST
jgi:hypothetical protein